MKKVTKLLCLTLAMLMVMSTSAFAVNFKVLPTTENFDDFELENVAGTASAAVSGYDNVNGGLSDLMGESTATKLNIRTVSGIGGKSTKDNSIYLNWNNKSNKGTAQYYTKVRPGKNNSTNEDDATKYDIVTQEINFLMLGNASNNLNYLCFKFFNGGAASSCASVDVITLNSGHTASILASGFVDAEENAVSRTFERGKWYNVALTYYGEAQGDFALGDAALYINGEYVGKKATGSTRTGIYDIRTYVGFTGKWSGENIAYYKCAFDDVKVYSGEYLDDYVAPAVETIASGEVNTANNVITVDGAVTAEDFKSMLTLNEVGAEARLYKSTTEVTTIQASVATVNDLEIADSELIESGNVLVVENKANNGYTYYTVNVDGFYATQNGAIASDLSDKANNIVFTYAATDVNEDRVLLAGVYNAAGDLIDVVMNEDGVVTFPEEGQEIITATVPAASLAEAATVKAFIWKDLTNIQPAGGANQEIILYAPSAE